MKEKINGMFSKIYKRYDLMNHLLSFNFDKSWRKEAAKDAMIPKRRYVILDVASGTGDLAIATSKMAIDNGKKTHIFAHDFNKDMLALAKEKFRAQGIKNIKVELGNAFHIKHGKNSIDVITSGFALRSFINAPGGKKNMQQFLSEAYRTLKPKGKVVLLDMAMPDSKLDRIFFKAYSVLMLAIGSFVDKDTYAWLVRTIKAFDKNELLEMMKSTGFRDVRIRSLKSGIAFIATGQK